MKASVWLGENKFEIQEINQFNLEKLVTKIYKLEEINEAIESTYEGGGMKYMIAPNKG